MFETDSLGYKLLNGKIKSHSEQLNKFVAGLFDSDGMVGLKFNSCGSSSYNNEAYYRIQLVSQIDQSASNDPDLCMIRSLKKHYGIGTVSFRAREQWAHQAIWNMAGKDSHIFYNLVGKHLIIKRKHFENMLWLYDELKGVRLTEEQIQELKEFSICSRDSSAKEVNKKHISPAYLAGLIAGDGWITVRLNVPRLRRGWLSHENQMSCAITLHELDSLVLKKIASDYGGRVVPKDKHMMSWRRNLGKESKSFALRFIPELLKYMCLPKKYVALKKILQFHKLPAETKCLELEKVCDSPRR